jgi:hypothetical protein
LTTDYAPACLNAQARNAVLTDAEVSADSANRMKTVQQTENASAFRNAQTKNVEPTDAAESAEYVRQDTNANPENALSSARPTA